MRCPAQHPHPPPSALLASAQCNRPPAAPCPIPQAASNLQGLDDLPEEFQDMVHATFGHP